MLLKFNIICLICVQKVLNHCINVCIHEVIFNKPFIMVMMVANVEGFMCNNMWQTRSRSNWYTIWPGTCNKCLICFLSWTILILSYCMNSDTSGMSLNIYDRLVMFLKSLTTSESEYYTTLSGMSGVGRFVWKN